MVDAIFSERRLAEIYDPLEPERPDLEAYLAMVEEFGARSVLDVGCGTGTFACLLAERGVDVVGVDPAAASLVVARGKGFGDRVTWVEGEVGAVQVQVEMVTMTGNVAQVFVGDDEWAAALGGVRRALVPGGRFVFETRDPARRGWEEWTRERTHRVVELPGVGRVETWTDLTEVALPVVSFRGSFVFEDGVTMTSDSTLRFRERDEVAESLVAAGFAVDGVREAPDRPGREFVFVATTR